MRRNNIYKTNFLIKLIFSFLVLSIVFLPNTFNQVLATDNEEASEFIYLSDIPYIASQSKSGWKELCMNQTIDGASIAVKIEGGYYSFNKGIWAHATSTVVYDISAYNYDYFTTYMGLNKTASSSSNGVKFYIYTSVDGAKWDLKTDDNPTVVKAGDNATFVKIDIKDAKYLKLVADANGHNGNDHSVYADAKLIKETYKEPGEDLVPSITELDEKIKTDFVNADLSTNKEYEYTLLKREFIKNVGNYALKKYLSESELNIETYTWLIGNKDNFENLKLYILGGAPDGGNYYNSLTQLSRLYDNYKDDFIIDTNLNNKWYPDMTKGDLYKKMAISLSLTHSTDVGLWMQISHPTNKSDAVTRYKIYKDLYDNGKFIVSKNADGTPKQDHTPWFEALQIEEMRYIMNNIIDDEEILWLNEYTQKRIDANPNKEEAYLQPHSYIAYVWPNYDNPIFHDVTKKDYWDEKLDGIFSKYGVTYSTETDKVYKLWMNLRNEYGTGAVCGGISKLGSNIRAVHGTPSTVICQPGHAALMYYRKNSSGQGYWTMDNGITGWGESGKTERMNIRMPLGWGSDSYVSGWAASYMFIGQAALNNFENYEKSEELIMLANTYNDNVAKKEEVLRTALEKENFNIDAWWELVKLYNNDSTKTEEDYYNLAEELGEALKPFPLPMYNLLNQIKGKFTSNEYKFMYALLETRLLNDGKSYTSTDVTNQPEVTRQVATFLLGQMDTSLGTFSFDGVDAGKIVLSSRFDGAGIRFDYSLDGKNTWKEVSFTADEEHKVQLTSEQIESITSENDIYIHIVGVDYSEENLYKIDITSQSLLSNLYANDLENRVIGVNLTTEWRYTEDDKWTSYSESSPDLTGNKTVQVRQAATGTQKESEVSPMYNFTEDNQPDTAKYVGISHLSIENYSSQSVDSKRPFYAPNAIDGNINTLWHTDFRYNVISQGIKPYIIVKLDEPRYISQLEFVQTKYWEKDPDYIKSGIVYVSEDGETWKEAGRIEDCPKNTELRRIEFEESIKGQYVKLELETYDMFASLAMVNLFEDITKVEQVIPTAGVTYSTTESTKEPVIARLVNLSTEVTITNNDGKDTYIFTENGEFTFEFEDKDGNKGTVTATVNWIDKSVPTAEVEYKLNPDKKLLVLLEDISENVYLLDKNNHKTNYIEVDNNKKITHISYLDSNGSVYKIIDIGEDGNIEKVTYKNTIEGINVRNYVTTLENGIVIDEKYYDGNGNIIEDLTDEQKEALRALQQTTSNPLEYIFEESGEYEFKILDEASNIAYKNIKVDYIDQGVTILASDITYNITSLTNQDVIATIKPYTIDEDGKREGAIVTNNNEEDTYTFTENGEFVFTYKATSDINNWEVKEHKATVNWIDKVAPEATIEYSTTEKTNKDVTATIKCDEEITITNNEGKNTYTFTENGEFTFEYEDKLGNKGTITATVNWIEKEVPPEEPPENPPEEPPVLPKPTIEYSTTEKTNKDVIVTIKCDEEIKITNNEGKNTYTFTENGEFTFEYEDKLGNKGTITATVTWIDKEVPPEEPPENPPEEPPVLPKPTIEYSTTEKTNKDVIVTIKCDEEIKITNNEGKNTYTFTENGEFTFEYEDKSGNKGTITAKVTWIEKEVPPEELPENPPEEPPVLPKATIEYSTTEKTNKDVTATIKCDEEITITNNEGKSTYTFTENGEFTFEYEDKLGNKGTITAKVTWIEKEVPPEEPPENPPEEPPVLPKPTIEYSTTEKTNKDVIVTIKCDEEIKITNNEGKNTYTFTENGEFTFEYEDKLGNKGTITATVTWIDKEVPPEEPPENPPEEPPVLPKPTIEYSITEKTNKDVTATIKCDEEITITNNEGKSTYTFTENGEFTFEYEDKLGNKGTITATVTWIDKVVPEATIEYSITEKTNKDVTATIKCDEEIKITNNEGKNTYTFTENGEFTFEYEDKLGNKGTITAKVTWINKETPKEDDNKNTVNDNTVNTNTTNNTTNTINLSNQNTISSNKQNDTIVVGSVNNNQTTTILNTGDKISIIAFGIIVITIVANIIQIMIEKKKSNNKK